MNSRNAPDGSSDSSQEIEAVGELHRDVDLSVAPLLQKHRDRLTCRRGCSACCIDDLSVFEVEADLIRSRHAELLDRESAHPAGGCAFLNSVGACRIYEDRPYVCRTQGLPLRWLEEDESEEIIERRSICELNEAGPPLASLAEEDCWQLGLVEDQLIRIQSKKDGSGTTRVKLRDLFPTRSR